MIELGIGVIGMGWMGQVHARSYSLARQRFPQAGLAARLVICSDNVKERAEGARALLGFAEATTDWRDVIAHPDVQIVNVATPNNLHVEIVEAAAAAGKHIFCEKPVGRRPLETAQIESIARKAGVLSFVGFNYRWAPLVIQAKKLIAEGALGDLTQYRGRFFSMYGSDPMGLLSWRFEREIAGYGVLGDILAHVTDMALYLNGGVKRLVSNSHTFIAERPLPIPGKGTHYSRGAPDDPTGPVTNEDYVGALLEFENGSRGVFEASRSIFGPKNQMAFELNGTKGAINWDFERMNELQLYLPGEDRGHDGFLRLVGGDQYPYHGNFNPGEGSGLGYEDMKVIEAFNFLQSVAEGEQRAPGLREALAVAEVHAAMTRSWESGAWEDVASLRKH
ncbi:MAG: Gfo/Idh/MocA family oxidoreductase [Chloroflexi bacterium]|nr:Gfo/Idh/MocA family oxidoreductase [Chloroflexota bacterium]